MSGFRLVMGLIGERPMVIEHALDDLDGDLMRWGRPRAGGPDDGQVAYSFREGMSSQIWLADVATGKSRHVAERPSNIVALDLDATGGTAYTVETIPPASRLIITRIDLATGGSTAMTELAFDEGPDSSVEAKLVEDGAMLVILSCGASCRVAGIRTDDGVVAWDRPTEASMLISDVPGAVGATRMCGLPCPTKLIDIASGDLRDLGRGCAAASLSLRDGQVAVVTDVIGRACPGRGDPPHLTIFQEHQAEPVAERDAPDGQAIVIDGGTTGYDIAPGWTLLAEAGSPASTVALGAVLHLFDIDSGALVVVGP